MAILLLFFSFRYDICEKGKGRKACYYTMLIFFVLFAGLRWRVGGDTTRYLYSFYHETPFLWDLAYDDLQIGGKPMWKILMSFVYSLFGRFYVVQLIESLFVNVLLFSYIKRHTDYIFTTVFLYFIAQYLILNTEIMKAAFSVVISLYVIDYMLDKKWIKAYVLLLIAVLFHPQAIFVAITPLLLFVRPNKWGATFLFLSLMAGFIIQITIGDYLDLLEGMGDSAIQNKIAQYGDSEYVEDRTLSWQLKNVYPLILYSSIILFTKRVFYGRLQRIVPLAMIGIAYQLVSLQVYIFYRIAEIYKIYLLIFVAYSVVELVKNSKNLQLSVAYSRSLLLFFPLVISLMFNTNISKRNVKYFPYTSIVKREIIKERELFVHQEDLSTVSVASREQY